MFDKAPRIQRGPQVRRIQVHVVGQERPALIYEMVVLYHPPMKRS